MIFLRISWFRWFFVLLRINMMLFPNLNGHEDKSFNVIYTIEKFEALKEEQIDKNTLLILDVDYTLTQPSNPAFQQANFCLNPQMVKDFVKSVPESVKSEFSNWIATSGEGQLLEEDVPLMIRAFKEKGGRVLIISGLLTGRWKEIPDMMDWRIRNLRRLGIETSDFGFNQPYQFKEFSSYRGEYPEIKEGVILTNGEGVKKHQILAAFLKKVGWQPKKVIFVDDSRPLIEQMADSMKQQGISFIGYEYKGAKLAKPRPIAKEDFEREWANLKSRLSFGD